MKESISVVSNLWIRQMEFSGVGDSKDEHVHKFDHQTLLAVGEFECTIEGKTTHFKAPQIVYVRKGLSHLFKCTTNSGLAYCVHPIRDGDNVEDIVSADQVPLSGGKLIQEL